jgi:hypothetical protein
MARMTSDCLPHQVERTKTLFGYFVDNGSQHQFKVGGRPATITISRGRSHGFNYVRAHRPRRRPSPTTAPIARREPAMPTTAPCPRRRHPTAGGCEDSVSRESDPN